ncbi:flagellar filament capping protein FliD [Paenibacillus sp. MBLB2552]|uniref:Flagellar hook-associated protein 2 n=1 Tax=Paenibacillus mellifer TaxID=2937794 RepID=A0A9X2BRK5_9BACL|nr:flagellar filament capping protein FliD [Paenibacillus mellifer]MCK8489047.1 flagellar filament capping protein FliD [Paenibacillus mellifer]
MRISGFASGMDIDSMVKELMQAKREPLNKLNQQKQLLDWKRENYREMSTKIVSFRNDKLLGYNNTFSMQAKRAELGGSNPNAVSVTASNSSTSLPVSIDVTNVAKASQVKIDLSVTGSSTLTTRETTLDKVITGDLSNIKINGKQIEGLTSTDTVSTLINKINSADAGVTAAFDTATQTLFITARETGEAAITTEGSLFSDTSKVTSFDGEDAVFSINGVAQTPQKSNIVDYDGLKITLKETGSATIQTKADTDKLVEAVKSFVSDYNNLIDSLNSKISEERYRKYAPLTEDQKKEMKEDEIKLWQDKAKSGLLRNDEIIERALSEMRSAVTGYVETGTGSININSIGLATGKWNEGGKLVIEDEAKLVQALEQNPDQVLEFFKATGNTTDTTETGIFNRVSKILNTSLNDLAEKAGTSRVSSDLKSSFLPNSLMGEEARNLDIRITNMLSKLTTMETNYYKQFTAMETAINKYNAQSGSLSSFLN